MAFRQSASWSPITESLSVVIPVYNSAATLGTLARRLAPVLSGVAAQYEVIFVNDGSDDNSWETIAGLSAEYQWVRGVTLLRNYGQHNALLCGIRLARYGVIATMDDDLENPPEELPKLLARLSDSAPLVYGTPSSRPHGWWRSFASRITRIALAAAMGSRRARSVSTFRVFRAQMRDAFARYESPLVSIDVLLTWGTGRFASVEVDSPPRPEGRSHYGFWQLVTVALNMATGFSVMPLRLATLIGFGFTMLGFVVLVYVIGRYIGSGGSVPGFPFLASIIAMFSGAQLFALGIVGEYLARTYLRMMDQPPYVVRMTTDDLATAGGCANLHA